MKENNVLVDSYESMSISELKSTVIRLWKEIKALEAEKKDYNKSIKDTITDLKERIDIVVHWVGVKETERDKEAIAEAAAKAMEGK